MLKWLLFWSLLLPIVAWSSDVVEISPITENILLIHFDDGYVEHHGQQDNADILHRSSLSLAKSAKPQSYSLTSLDDPNYSGAVQPVAVGRKSKGKDFTRNWPDLPWVSEHYIYLQLPTPLQQGKTYTMKLDNLAKNSNDWTFVYDVFSLRSETMHVNQIGYAPAAPLKLAYLSQWMGDLGPLALDEFKDAAFYLVETASNQVVFTGKISKRKDLEKGGADCAYDTHAPYGSFTGADVWTMNFSDFITPGEYRIVVEHIGCSYPFRIDDDAYREAFFTTIRGLYHQRCGIALEEPYTHWTRARCHHPAETDTVVLSDWMYMDGGNAFAQLPETATAQKRPYWGGWHDAADWDRHHHHLNACQMLLLAYEFRPQNFSDDELNIPESGNGLPDIIDEAKWTVDFFKRMQEEDGSVHGGIETWRHPGNGISSVADRDQWYAYAPDPIATYHFAGAACQLAFCLEIAGAGESKAEYVAAAERAYQWALDNTLGSDENLQEVRDMRQFAAAWLFKVTGRDEFQVQFKKDNKVKTAATELEVWESHDQQWAVWTYVTTQRPNVDQTLQTTLKKAVEAWAISDHINNADKRGYRFGKDWWQPVMVAHATTPNIFPVMVAYEITKNDKYLSYCYTSADYTLGANPLNMCWVPGIGENYPHEYMHLDSWYFNLDKEMVPGIIPYGPYNYDTDFPDGPWEASWGMKSAYPAADKWPSHELWFENRWCPIVNEFTVYHTIGPAAAAFGYLSKPGGKFSTAKNRPAASPVASFGLLPNFPNPFNGQTTIVFTLQRPTSAQIDIFDVAGRRVRQLAERAFDAGVYALPWDGLDDGGNSASSGVYYTRLTTDGYMQTQKMMLVK